MKTDPMDTTTKQEDLDGLLSCMRQKYGSIEGKVSKLDDSGVQIEVYICRPTQNDCLTLFTAGMSINPMPDPPAGWEKRSRCELYVQVQPNWKPTDKDGAEKGVKDEWHGLCLHAQVVDFLRRRRPAVATASCQMAKLWAGRFESTASLC